jgi:hypothetical protein
MIDNLLMSSHLCDRLVALLSHYITGGRTSPQVSKGAEYGRQTQTPSEPLHAQQRRRTVLAETWQLCRQHHITSKGYHLQV